LARRGSSASNESASVKSKDQRKDSTGVNKKVSFTQSSDATDPSRFSDNSEATTLTESSFGAGQQYSLVDETMSTREGRNLPLPSNWFAQAVNVAVKAMSSRNNTSQDSGSAALVDGKRHCNVTAQRIRILTCHCHDFSLAFQMTGMNINQMLKASDRKILNGAAVSLA
jgi:hypothetical protein